MRYFKKELLSNPVWLPSGGKFPFDNIGNNEGVLATDDLILVTEAERAMAAHRGGIIEITVEEYDELIKKKQDSPSQPNLPSDPFQVPRLSLDPNRFNQAPSKPEAAAAAAVPKPTAHGTPDPIAVPKPEEFKAPRTIKSRVAKVRSSE